MKLSDVLIPGALVLGLYLMMRGSSASLDEGGSFGSGSGGGWSESLGGGLPFNQAALDATNKIASRNTFLPVGSYNPVDGVLMTRTGGMSIAYGMLPAINPTTGAPSSVKVLQSRATTPTPIKRAKIAVPAGTTVKVGSTLNPTFSGGVSLV